MYQEYLGDWVNVLGHQKAAHGIILELYTPTSILEKEEYCRILSWYSHFDIVTSFLSNSALTLGNEWFIAIHEYYAQLSQRHPEDVDLRIEALQSRHKLIDMDTVVLLAKAAKKQISVAVFMQEDQKLSEAIASTKNIEDPVLTDPDFLVYKFEGAPCPLPDDIVDPYTPGKLFTAPLWTMNFVILGALSRDLLHRYRKALLLGQRPPPELAILALEICRVFETIEYWPHGPPGAVVSAHAALGIAALVLPKDEKHIMWCRRKFALIESRG